MRILVTGGTGFIGRVLLPALVQAGHDVLLLSRQQSPLEAEYVSQQNLADIPSSEPIEAIINLAGASMAGQRWSTQYKRELVNSRVDITTSLLQLARRLDKAPTVLLSASAIGYYGHHGDELLAEDARPEPGFAQTLCQEWESVAWGARELGTRVVCMRLGVVLDEGGGAFDQMAGSFRFGLGSWLGSGRQWLSWVHRADVVAAILRLLEDESLSGPINITAPEPVTSREFCRVMARHYFTLLSLPVPAPAARMLVGEMADELLLQGQRVIPAALQAAGFNFQFPTLDEAVAAIR